MSEAAFGSAENARAAGDYNQARNFYLKAAEGGAAAAEARARLFDITWGIGAREEARHHLGKLENMVGPRDPRVIRRRALAVETPK